jgi:uncharacterized protein
MDLRGATGLVTGASSGIGMATAEALAAAGVALAVSGRRGDELQNLAERITLRGAPRPVVLSTDLAMPSAAAELGARASEALGRIDILVNSAGAFESGSAAADDATARALFETNYWAPMALTRILVPGMRAYGRGVVVNLSSIAMVTPLPAMGSYPASKAALATATEAMRIELAGSGVHLVLAFLGGVDTPMHAKASEAYGRALRWMPLGRPEVAARRILTAIRRNRPTVVYPRAVVTMRWFPTISAWISRHIMLPLLPTRPVSDQPAA